MTTTGNEKLPDHPEGSFDLEDHLKNLRQVQLYMMRMDMVHPVDSPMEYLAPHIQEHILWLATQEKNGVLFLSGANAAGQEWDGSGTAIIRASSLEAAVAISDTEPFHREGLRVNTVHGWQLNEGTVRLTFSLFSDSFSLD
ncbi:YciI family protein [Catenulispora pinisilvae]|uniref:YciI family protein n=1 Tax=Catenulispora pinisilvae TaxID=2705253 RepID=UPI00189172D9|nr:YciI family protein [Catenulispora pinisilvae]